MSPTKTIEMDRGEVCALVSCVTFFRESAGRAWAQVPEGAQHAVSTCDALLRRLSGMAAAFEQEDGHAFYERFGKSLGARNPHPKPPDNFPKQPDPNVIREAALRALRDYQTIVHDTLSDHLLKAAIALIEIDARGYE